MAQFTMNEVELVVPDAYLTPKIKRQFERGQYENQEARSVLLSVDHGDRVLELGAGVGYIGALAGMIAGPQNVVSVEANPDLLEIIEDNFRRNDCGKIDLRHGAVIGDDHAAETISFRQARAFWASSLGEGAGLKVDVPALKFSALMAEIRPNVVVMDVEGAEEAFFDAPWPDHVRVLLMEIHPKRYADTVVQKIFDCLSRSGLIYSADLSKGKALGFLRQGIEI